MSIRQLLFQAIQLGAFLLLANSFRLEEAFGFRQIVPVIFIGFVVHALLPLRWRLPFFALLSIFGILVVLGVENGAVLVAIGLVLIGISHLPISIRLRSVILIVVTGLLIGIRVSWISAPLETLPTLILPILGSMFMFRLVVYLHSIHHQKTAGSIWTTLSYFFLLPNVCFPLFPVVDYDTFRRKYFDKAAGEIYQRGLRGVFRGISHLILYRIVYHYLVPTPGSVEDLGGVLAYVVSSYLLYLRISGLFHLSVGILGLFGFDLPRTNYFYFLASSITDFWRRINVYWKDFMLKLVYQPLVLGFRRRGMALTGAMVVGTLVTLIISWFLHSYQWLWLRGTFPIRVQDGVFWCLLGVLAAANVYLEARKGRRRSLGKKAVSWRQAGLHSLKVAGTFSFMSILWSFWTASSVPEWIAVMSVAATARLSEVIRLIGFVMLLLLLGTIFQVLRSRRPPSPSASQLMDFGLPLFQTTVALFLVLGLPVLNHFGIKTAETPSTRAAVSILGTIRGDRLNERDEEQLTKGYYEQLLGNENWNSAVWTVNVRKPVDWDRLRSNGAARNTNDLRVYELIPSIEASYAGSSLRTNSWGMRDNEYSLEKPPNTFRVALLGSSYSMGTGVEQHQTFEELVERRLNQEFGNDDWDRFEILNFSVPGYSVLSSLIQAREVVFQFEPDVIMLVGTENDDSFAVRMLARALKPKLEVDDPNIEEVIRRSGASADMNVEERAQKLEPFADELLRSGYRMVADSARDHGAIPVYVYLPRTVEAPDRARRSFARTSEWLHESGFVTIFLGEAYGEHERKSLWVAPWDNHPNAVGHQLIADVFYEELTAETIAVPLGLSKPDNNATTEGDSPGQR